MIHSYKKKYKNNYNNKKKYKNNYNKNSIFILYQNDFLGFFCIGTTIFVFLLGSLASLFQSYSKLHEHQTILDIFKELRFIFSKKEVKNRAFLILFLLIIQILLLVYLKKSKLIWKEYQLSKKHKIFFHTLMSESYLLNILYFFLWLIFLYIMYLFISSCSIEIHHLNQLNKSRIEAMNQLNKSRIEAMNQLNKSRIEAMNQLNKSRIEAMKQHDKTILLKKKKYQKNTRIKHLKYKAKVYRKIRYLIFLRKKKDRYSKNKVIYDKELSIITEEPEEELHSSLDSTHIRPALFKKSS